MEKSTEQIKTYHSHEWNIFICHTIDKGVWVSLEDGISETSINAEDAIRLRDWLNEVYPPTPPKPTK